MNEQQDVVTVGKFDRIRGGLQGVALFTKPSTIKTVQNITGKSESFIVESARFDELGGDFIFIEMVDEAGVVRIALPPKVANTIAAQRDSLTARRRSAAGKRQAAARKEAGILPGFMKGKAKK